MKKWSQQELLRFRSNLESIEAEKDTLDQEGRCEANEQARYFGSILSDIERRLQCTQELLSQVELNEDVQDSNEQVVGAPRTL